MTSNIPEHPGAKQPASDTKQAAPRGLLLWIIPLAAVAVVVLLLGIHFTGGMK